MNAQINIETLEEQFEAACDYFAENSRKIAREEARQKYFECIALAVRIDNIKLGHEQSVEEARFYAKRKVDSEIMSYRQNGKYHRFDFDFDEAENLSFQKLPSGSYLTPVGVWEMPAGRFSFHTVNRKYRDPKGFCKRYSSDVIKEIRQIQKEHNENQKIIADARAKCLIAEAEPIFHATSIKIVG